MWKIKIEYEDQGKLTLTGNHKDIPLRLAREYYRDYVVGSRCKAIYQRYPKKDYPEMDFSEKIKALAEVAHER